MAAATAPSYSPTSSSLSSFGESTRDWRTVRSNSVPAKGGGAYHSFGTAKTHQSSRHASVGHGKSAPVDDLATPPSCRRPLLDATNSQDLVDTSPIRSILALGSDEALVSLHIPHGLPLETIAERRSRSTLDTRQSSGNHYVPPPRRAKSAPERWDASPTQRNDHLELLRGCDELSSILRKSSLQKPAFPSESYDEVSDRRSSTQPFSPPQDSGRKSKSVSKEAPAMSFAVGGDRQGVSPTARVRDLLYKIKECHVQAGSVSKSSEVKQGIPGIHKRRKSASPGVTHDNASDSARRLAENLHSNCTEDSPSSLHCTCNPSRLLVHKRRIPDRHTTHNTRNKNSLGRHTSPASAYLAQLVPAPLTIRNKHFRPNRKSNDGSPVARRNTTQPRIVSQTSSRHVNSTLSSPCSTGEDLDSARDVVSGTPNYYESCTSLRGFDTLNAPVERSIAASDSSESVIAGQSAYQRNLVSFHDAVSTQRSKSGHVSSNCYSSSDPFFESPLQSKSTSQSPDANDVPLPLCVRQKKPPPSLQLFPAVPKSGDTRMQRQIRTISSMLHIPGLSKPMDDPTVEAGSSIHLRPAARTCPHGKPIMQPTVFTGAKLKGRTARQRSWFNSRRAQGCWRCELLVSDSLIKCQRAHQLQPIRGAEPEFVLHRVS